MIVTDANFNEIINTHETILIDFWAEWCGPCKMLSPILDEISKEHREKNKPGYPPVLELERLFSYFIYDHWDKSN